MAERALHAFDTSVIIAALLGWHEHHKPALSALQRAFDDARVVVPGPALVESYSVMTRMPAPHRVAASDALELLEGTFQEDALTPALGSAELWRFLRGLPQAHVAGGRTYDAHILACAVKAKASVLWTFNDDDFAALDHGAIELRNPASPK
jgi:predicted nucleic acid-binding protein